MARITRVAKAQQRYETKPVLDADGKPVRIPLTNRDGSPKMTSAKGGRRTPRPITIAKTEADKTRPKPNLRCDFPGCDVDGGEILPGTAYMWIKPKSGPYGGHQRNRHQTHPAWQVWDYSDSLSANVARIEHDATEAVNDAETADDVTAALDDAAEGIRELAERKREGASNIEEGFGHPTSQSEDLESQADELESWADEVGGTDLEDLETFDCQAACTEGRRDCDNCGGTGRYAEADREDGGAECDECSGAGDVECEDCDGTGHDLEAARESWSEAVSDALGNCPV